MTQECKVIKNFFTADELGIIKAESDNYFKSKNILQDSSNWQEGLNSSGQKILFHYCQPNLDSEVWEITSKRVKEYFPEFRVKAANFHYAPEGSWINWHNDSHQDAAISVYLNSQWKTHWGGFFYYEISGKFYIEYPATNKGIFQRNKVPHAVTPIAWGAPVRKSLQIWLKYE